MVPWISIITVVKDDAKGFIRTADSLRSQSMTDYEWIVIDSSSRPIEPSQDMEYVWTEPRGVFPAMNVGTQQAKGHYVYFLNSGDTLHDPLSLATARAAMSARCDALICRVRFVYSPNKFVEPPVVDIQLESKYFYARGLFPPHQGMLIRRQLLNSVGGFNEQFIVASDYEAFLKLAAHASFCTADTILADFYVGGVSTNHWLLAQKEFHEARVNTLQLGSFNRCRELFWTFRGIGSNVLARLLGRV